MSLPSSVFLITGVSSGLGLALAKAAMAAGHCVVGTVRNDDDARRFAALHPELAHALHLDVTDTSAIAPAMADVVARFGRLDVLINNAGYGHEGVFEESTLAQLRHQFEVNVFGAVAMMQAALPYMRRQRRGHIFNVTSMGGLTTFPGLSFYHGSKFALEGIGEALAKEVREFGIRVTSIEPGAFRTDWAGRSMVRAERHISDYDGMFAPMREARQARSGHQRGNPDKLAEVVLKVWQSENPPQHLLLGGDAWELVQQKLQGLQQELEEWKGVTFSTDFVDEG